MDVKLKEAETRRKDVIKDMQDKINFLQNKEEAPTRIVYDNTNEGTKTLPELEKLDLMGYNKLMITILPDDEIF